MKYLVLNLVVGAALVWLMLADRPMTASLDALTTAEPRAFERTAPTSPVVTAVPAPVAPRPVSPPSDPRNMAPPVTDDPLIPDVDAVPRPQAATTSIEMQPTEHLAPSMPMGERARRLRMLARDMETLFLKTVE